MVKIQIGTMGISLEHINVGETGEAYFPDLDLRDVVYAVEEIRKNKEIIIIGAKNSAVEHTPTELKYETLEATWERVCEAHPLPVTIKHTKWAFKEYTAAITRDDFCTNAESPSADALKPTAGKKLIVQDILIFASAASDVTIEGGDGVTYYKLYKCYLAANGGSNVLNLGATLKNANDHLYISVTAGNVSITITADEK